MKKRIFPILMMIFALLSIISCDSSLIELEEGNINYYIYPYVKFTLSEDGFYYTAMVVKGAKLSKASIPGFVHSDLGPIPVKEFAGFEDINDSVNLEELTLDVHVERIKEGALDKASNLKVIKTSGENESPKWAYLTVLYKENYHFEGWKAGDAFVYNGMPIDPEYKEAVPVWSKLIHHDAKEANCVTVGNIEYWECSVCGKYFTDPYARTEVDDVLLPAEGHQYPLTYVGYKAATCLEAGKEAHYKCERCHKTFSDASGTEEISNVVIPALGHSYGDWYTVTEATCTEPGLKRRGCVRCDYFETEVISALGHNLGDWFVYTAATCTEDGEERRTCSRCDYYESRTIDATGHVSDGKIYGIDDSDYHWYHCIVDDVIYGKEIHTYGDWRDTEAPGMSRERECSVCHHIDYTELPHIWHYVEPVEPDCTNSGNYGYWWCELHTGEYTSDEAHEVIITRTDIFRPIAGHTMEHHPYNAETCRNDGNTEYWYCTVCHKYFSDALGNTEIELSDTVITHHTVIKVEAVSPTCTEEGNIEYWHCSKENRYFSDEACTNEITAVDTVAPALGHTFHNPPIVSDYHHDDYRHWLYCERCKKEFYVDEGILTEGKETHIWGEPEVCDDGLHYVRTCTVCGSIKNEDVPSDKKYEVSIGEITISLPESPPCGDMTINGMVVEDRGSSVLGERNVQIGFSPHVNSNRNYDLYCWYVRNGRTVYLKESEGTFNFTISGSYQYTIVIQAYNEGGSISKEYSVRL